MEDENENSHMMSDEERRELALDILSDVENMILASEAARSNFVGFDHTLDGEPIPRFEGESPDGYGAFICEYMPLDAAVTLIFECEQFYERARAEYQFSVIFNGDEPRETVRRMATIATKVLLNNMQGALSTAITESFLTASLIGKSFLEALMARGTESLGKQLEVPVSAVADRRKDVEEAARRVADNKRIHLRGLLSRLPNMVAETRRGPKKRITLESIRYARDKVKSEGMAGDVLNVSVELGCHETTIYKILKDANKTLDEL